MIATLVASLLVPAVPGAAHDAHLADQQDALALHNCHEVLPLVEVSKDAATQLLPSDYDPSLDELGKARLQIVTRYCETLTVDGVTVHDVIDSYISVVIQPPYGSDTDDVPHSSFLTLGEHDDSSDDPGLTRLEAYIVQWVTNNETQESWLKARTALGERVRLVPDLAYDYEPASGALDARFRFEAPASAPSPFHVEAMVAEPGPQRWDAGQNLWAETEAGTVIIFGEHHKGADHLFGPAEGTITSDDRNSLLGQAFADEQTRPLSGGAEKAFSSSAFTDARYTKCLRNRSNPCTRGTHVRPQRSRNVALGPIQKRCDEIIGWVPTRRENVEPLVPDPFEVAERTPGVATLFVRTYRCFDVALAGVTIPQETGSQVAVSIRSPDEQAAATQEGERIVVPGVITVDPLAECCNWYLLSWATDSEQMARWLREGPLPLPLESPRVAHVASGIFDFEPLPGTTFTDPDYRFVTAPGSPIPFELRASTTDPSTGFVSEIAYWVLDPTGRPLKVFGSSNICIGYGDGVVLATDDGEMAQLIGAEIGPFASAYAANRFSDGFYAKGRPGEHLDPFARSDEVAC